MTTTITDHGAVGDGTKLATSAIQTAIDACAKAGGGTVVVPPGRYVSGTIELRSRVDLHLEAGAVLVGSPRLEDYRDNGFVHVDNHFSGAEGGKSLSLIYAGGAEDVGIRGRGTIDMSSDAFFDFDTLKPMKGVDEADLTAEQRAEATVVKKDGPTLPIFFASCTRVEISGVRFVNAPSWTINFTLCTDVKVHHITIRDDLRVPISDGIHICGSTDVIISESVISCGDDCVAITGVTSWDTASERIVITNCTMQSSSAGVRVGFLASKVRDVVVSNLAIHDSSRGFTIFAGDDGWVENVSIANVIVRSRIRAGNWWGKGEPLVICAAQSSGRIENVTVRGMTARCENGAVIAADGGSVRNIVLDDWTVELAHGPNHALFGGVIDLEPVGLLPAPVGKAPWLHAWDATGLRLSNIRYRASEVDGTRLPARAICERTQIDLERDVSEVG